MQLSEILEKCYPHSSDETRPVELLADATKWCLIEDVWYAAVCQAALQEAGVPFPDVADIRLISMLVGDPELPRVEAEDKIEPPPAALKRADRFNSLLIEHYDYDPGKNYAEDEPVPWVMILRDLFLEVGEPEHILRLMVAADERLRVGMAIASDQFYSPQELKEFFEDEDIVSRCLDELGYRNKPEPLVSGVEILAWIDRTFPSTDPPRHSEQL